MVYFFATKKWALRVSRYFLDVVEKRNNHFVSSDLRTSGGASAEVLGLG